MTPGEAEDTEQTEEERRPGGQFRGRDVQVETGPGLVTEDQTQEEEESQADGGGHGPPEPEKSSIDKCLESNEYFEQ